MLKKSLTLLLGTLCLMGCQTMNKVTDVVAGPTYQPVAPGAGQQLEIDHIVVFADASASMYTSDLFEDQKELIENFVKTMPEGSYEAAIDAFSGTTAMPWQWNALAPFNRGALADQAGALEQTMAGTMVALSLDELQKALNGRQGPGALVVFSDGKANDTLYWLEQQARELDAAHRAPLCIFAVQMGDDPAGTEVLQALVDAGGHGALWNADAVDSIEGMQDMARRVFFEPCAGDGDADGDGVPDSADQCPDTPRGARVDSRGCWVIQGLKFDYDKSNIKSQYHGALDEVVAVLNQNPDVHVSLDGHTDSDGSKEYNQRLSRDRATAVRDYLVNKGIPAARIDTQGYGESNPIAPNDTPENKAQNRRVEVTPTQR